MSVLEWTAGNAWHGNVLIVKWLVSSENGKYVIHQRGLTSSPFPLEQLSPITDRRLLRPSRQTNSSMGANGLTISRFSNTRTSSQITSSTRPIVYPNQPFLSRTDLQMPRIPSLLHNNPVARPRAPGSRLPTSTALTTPEYYHVPTDQQQCTEISKAVHYHLCGNLQYWTVYPEVSNIPQTAILPSIPLMVVNPTCSTAYLVPQMSTAYTSSTRSSLLGQTYAHGACVDPRLKRLAKPDYQRGKHQAESTDYKVSEEDQYKRRERHRAESNITIQSSLGKSDGPVIANGAMEDLDINSGDWDLDSAAYEDNAAV